MRDKLLSEAFKSSLETLVGDCLWEIDVKSLYVDYVVYKKGECSILAVGWQWQMDDEDFIRCAKVSEKVTDYYASYERSSYKKTGVFSHEVDPKTMAKICEYRRSKTGMHKYSMSGEILQTNRMDNLGRVTIRRVLKGSPFELNAEDVMLVSEKPYGEIAYIDVKKHCNILTEVKDAVFQRGIR